MGNAKIIKMVIQELERMSITIGQIEDYETCVKCLLESDNFLQLDTSFEEALNVVKAGIPVYFGLLHLRSSVTNGSILSLHV
ncbi:UNVERIFIED_CONTAM: hypothetical protein PYX00_009273 [Menopon gallinae]|uniref:Uncharacterized protein n=1 Tax=Menopon gallinae TaxID=328185 RepID=A0AAW2HAM7_9NEOP